MKDEKEEEMEQKNKEVFTIVRFVKTSNSIYVIFASFGLEKETGKPCAEYEMSCFRSSK